MPLFFCGISRGGISGHKNADMNSLGAEINSIDEKREWPEQHPASHKVEAVPGKVVWLTSFVPPYAVSMYQSVGEQLQDFLLLLSTEMEKGRTWTPDVSLPNTRIQRTLSWTYQSRHPNGSSQKLQSHFPYDTVPLLLKEKPQVVISSELGTRTLQALAYRLMRPSTRLIVKATLSEVTEQGRGRLRNWLRRILLKRADAVMTNGQSGARYLGRFGVPSEKLFIVPSTTEMTELMRVPLQRPSGAAFRLLYVGRLIQSKGLLPFFEVLRAWATAHVARVLHLSVVGSGELQSSLQEFGFPANVIVEFVGEVPFAKLPDLYVESGILVLPTFSDEWGLVVNEGMAAGLPVLGSTYGQAVEELVEDGITGWTFRPDYPNEMYAALDRALNTSESCLNEMRNAVRARICDLTPQHAAALVMDAVRFVSRP
jgi:glycosyltransferase involved in cell wall biosynthesis